MKILMATPELAGLAKVGGLADMVSSLAKTLGVANDVRIIMPFHSSIIKKEDSWIEHPFPIEVKMGKSQTKLCKLWETKLDDTKVKIYLIEYNDFFQRANIYEGQDNGYRFAFFDRAVIDVCSAIDFIPDVIHCHDWTTGLIPVYLNTKEKFSPIGKAATCFTIHNMAHQGVFSKDVLSYAGLPDYLFSYDNLECLGGINFLKGGLYHSTKITTVSPTYAKEIKTPQFGCGLDYILRFKAADLCGILNGIDYNTWNPNIDKFLPKKYSTKSMSGKASCKKALQKKFGLTQNEKIPLFGVIARLYDQKGLDLLANIAPYLMDNMQIQMVILGAGDRCLENAFSNLSSSYKGKLGTFIGYDEELSHLIEAGSDFFIMPSRFEPCGLNQMYSMNYGTLPIANATGGLADTIEQYHQKEKSGTGFLLYHLNEKALYNTLGWAVSTWYDRKPDYLSMQKKAMKKDFSWAKSAREYEEVYSWAISARKIAF